jgi:hypothetical protein
MDADVRIDILRGFPNAVAWLAGLSEPIGVAGFAAIELVEGCHDKDELRAVRRLLTGL